MAKTGILVISNPAIFQKMIPRLRDEIRNTLYVQISPEKQVNVCPGISPTFPLSTSIINLYKSSLDIRHLDVRVLLSSLRNPTIMDVANKIPIEVVLYQPPRDANEVKAALQNKTVDCRTEPLKECEELGGACVPWSRGDSYNYVVVGGTFDRLHIGHKILLTEAILKCKQKLTVGVTDTNMLKSKKLWELIEPCKIRINKVRDFLEEVEPLLEYDIVPINDIFGPTRTDPTFELLVVSGETLGGAEKVNEVRVKEGLKALQVHSVDLVPDKKQDEEEEEKVSSSNDRLRLLGTLISPPQPKPDLPLFPYIIGLTGGMASGKTSISTRFQTLGAAVINCDKIAHSLYTQGSPLYSELINIFGKDIISQTGEIDRKILGGLVFNNKEKLQTLNRLLWPAILERSMDLARGYYLGGQKVVILEAAVLLQAGWDPYIHEIWAAIIPPEEAVRRMISRDGISEEEALRRLSSQPSNLDCLAKANVVFSTLWREDFTQKQVERAWASLQLRLPPSSNT